MTEKSLVVTHIGQLLRQQHNILRQLKRNESYVNGGFTKTPRNGVFLML